ncbi:hypothetical protein ASPWEDRAFT_176667 [Aspergillus wentii DTO 134E9]|uniref:Mid2 domain-containing protein n=1 Tax=Aspergillus wentii DTO 134E9 TaxID=1073089 RepID=A0A1L9R9K4_ASPWE|nr:uncharacterized protein ASPWEDRAFT_176667 [Aspergillus wentii DTO 134E9]KAI9926364.1 hypothetical protein MW887_004128 [Aspergillus wentii]OJJ31602.1 hypothetical protein ASPWEDRAFT_176667 [Aspergillus wentii DTO 134E9]
MKLRLSLCLGLLWLAPALADTTCYNLDGSIAADDVPCESSGTSNCCNSNDLCMSNGLCYMQGWRGFSLTRGSCTDKSWGAKCYAPCSDYNRNSGYPIVNMGGFSGKSTNWCCGSVTYENGKATCAQGDSFTLETGRAVVGAAALANYTEKSTQSSNTSDASSPDSTSSSSSGSSSGSSSRDAAIGAGVGVPLGVIALASIGWALWERRGRKKAIAQGVPMQSEQIQGQGFTGHELGYRHPIEIGTSGRSVSELGTARSYKAPIEADT